MTIEQTLKTAPLPTPKQKTYPIKNAGELDPLLERIGNARCVMLGEATHGTHEYYTWRMAISKRLIEEKGFNFIAVEGDWPDCYRLNRYIKGYADQDKKSHELLRDFRRWPTWMWANWEVDALLNWLKLFNNGKPANNRVGFYGLDVYSLWESMDALVGYLQTNDPKAAELAKQAIRCFEPYEEDPHKYARSQYSLESSCRQEVINLLAEIRKKSPVYDSDPEAALNTEQNAHIAVNAEEYYSNMMSFNDNTWNLRDTHMMETLQRLMQFHGPDAKAIVWEHNTHIGDARYTDMQHHGMYNTGQLAREQLGEKDTVLVGFGSYLGTVIAGKEWGAPMEVMPVPAARGGSVEELMHRTYAGNRMLIFDRKHPQKRWNEVWPHRAVGVVYNPLHEKHGNYVPTILGSRYDAFLFIDETTALHPLHIQPDGHLVPETYPFNF
ncbi:erythromycin esterase family protein [Mucilaginibacter sp.]|uniref:erythromycin esterase family protein n=1 Tax=Mucilaginibacter sp. TaxID=1882438 RepID=UPI00260CA2ED|nr:erythromycin esterase family protein [Mucilaginibacter sp.]MDB4924428.1 protein-L-isoaspartate O-methyltransferase [Mucilaginibacter sp.]